MGLQPCRQKFIQLHQGGVLFHAIVRAEQLSARGHTGRAVSADPTERADSHSELQDTERLWVEGVSAPAPVCHDVGPRF